MARSTFPLRFRRDQLRELVREVAAREGISQNELLELAAENEVLVRGALLADELERTAARLRSVSEQVMDELIAASLDSFAEAEVLPDPMRPRQFVPRDPDGRTQRPSVGAVAAFRSA